jgi:hypothetical protein
MAAGRRRQVQADEYRARALGASTLAADSSLERVREKHELAATRWLALAALHCETLELGSPDASPQPIPD